MKKSEIKNILKEQRYIGAIFRYGVVPVLLLLDEYEENNDFEECNIIFSAISYMNQHLKGTQEYETLPTRYSTEELEKLKSAFNLFGLRRDTTIENFPIYIEEIKKMVKL